MPRRLRRRKSGKRASPLPQLPQRARRTKIRWSSPASRAARGYEPSKPIGEPHVAQFGRGTGALRTQLAYVTTGTGQWTVNA